MRASIFAVFCVSLFLLGCAETKEVTVTYDPEQNRTTYETKSYSVSRAKLGSGLTSSNTRTLTVQAFAQCQGSGCTPQTVRLAFSTKGNGRLAVTGAGGELVADSHRISWSSKEAGGRPSRGGGRLYEVRGVFATVDLRLSEFQQIATASMIDGSVGGKPLSFDTDVQSGFRTLLNEIQGNGPQ